MLKFKKGVKTSGSAAHRDARKRWSLLIPRGWDRVRLGGKKKAGGKTLQVETQKG